MRRRPFLLGVLALVCSTLVAGAAVPAGAGGSKPPAVPKEIQVPAGQRVVLDVTGKGVQIYDCRPSAADPNVRTWTFREPAATLYGHRAARPASTSSAPPSSRSTAAPRSGHAPLPSSRIPRRSPGCCWRPTPTGRRVLSQVDFIQRLETRGGLAPAGACDPADDATVAVPYRARYVFYAG